MHRCIPPVLVALLLPALACAQIPTEFSVQGRLVQDDGAPLTDPTSVTLRLYDVPTGGTAEASETDLVVPDASGVFATRLGDDTSLDPALFEGPLWVSLEIQDGGELDPRLPLVSLPQALEADGTSRLVPTTTVDLGGFGLTGLGPSVEPGDAARRDFVEAGDAALQASLDAHALDASVHFTAGEVSLATTQVTGLDAAVDASTHAQDGSVHFPQSAIQISSAQIVGLDGAIGSSSHALDAAVHFPQAAITVSTTQVAGIASVIATSTHALSTSNPHGVTKAQVGFPELPDLLDQLSATRAPTSTDDGSAGYAVGSRWIDTASRMAYVLTTLPGVGQAGWRALTPGVTVVEVAPVYTGGVLDPVASGAALEAARAGITDASPEHRYLLRLGPGTYTLSTSLQLGGNITLEGAGRELTRVELDTQVVPGARGELRNLTLVADPTGFNAVRLFAGDDVLLEGVGIEGAGFTTPFSRAVFSDDDGITLRIRDCRFVLDHPTGSVNGVVLLGTTTDSGRVEIEDSEFDLTAATNSYGVRMHRGHLRIRESAFVQQVGTTGNGVHAPDAAMSSVEIRRLSVDLTSSSNTDAAAALELGGADCAVEDSVLVVNAGDARGILEDCARSSLLRNRITVTATGDAGFGIQGGATKGEVLARGNLVDLTPGDLASAAYHLTGSARVSASGNEANVNGAAGTGDVTGLLAETAARAVLTGNLVTVSSGVADRRLLGLGVWAPGGGAADRAGLSGNRVKVTRSSGATGIATGIHLVAEGGIDGGAVTVSNTGDRTTGILVDAPDDASLSGLQVKVTGTTDTVGVISRDGGLRLGGSTLEVDGDGAGVAGLEVHAVMTGSALQVLVDNTSGADDTYGLHCVPATEPGCILGASRILVTDGSPGAGPGTTYVVDPVNDAGSSTLDARLDGCETSAEARGGDVTCTDSVCP